MKTLLIIHQPGKAPRVGYPLGDEATSLRKWQESHPGAAIYVLQAPDVPPPGTAVVVTAEEFLAIDDAMSAASLPDRVLRQEVGDAACNGQRIEAALETALAVLEQIATTPRNRGAKRSAAAALAFLRTQLAAVMGMGNVNDRDTDVTDRLRIDYINSLPQPFFAHFWGGSEWPVLDIDVETGLLRIDVCGRIELKHIGDVKSFIDHDGVEHDADSFYND